MIEVRELEGALITLQPAQPSPAMAEHFCDPQLLETAALHDGTSLEALTEMIRRGRLNIWDIYRGAGKKSIGYAFFVWYDGPPFFAVHMFSGKYDLDLCRDCFLVMVEPFFRETDEPALFFYEDRPVDDTLHGFLIDAGFDPFDDNPTLDNAREACYVLERHTFDAYYGEEFDEDDAFRDGGLNF